MSDHGPIVALHTLKVWLGQWPSFTGMEHGAPNARVVHMGTGLVTVTPMTLEPATPQACEARGAAGLSLTGVTVLCS